MVIFKVECVIHAVRGLVFHNIVYQHTYSYKDFCSDKVRGMV